MQTGESSATLLEVLASGPRYGFRNWPNPKVPRIAAGVYTVWDGEQFIYAGLAGRGLTAADIAAHRASGC